MQGSPLNYLAKNMLGFYGAIVAVLFPARNQWQGCEEWPSFKLSGCKEQQVHFVTLDNAKTEFNSLLDNLHLAWLDSCNL
jgi:hypothetical protein